MPHPHSYIDNESDTLSRCLLRFRRLTEGQEPKNDFVDGIIKLKGIISGSSFLNGLRLQRTLMFQ